MNTFSAGQSIFEMAVRRRERRRQLVVLVMVVSLLGFVGGFFLFSWIGSTVFGFAGFATVSFLVDYTEQLDKVQTQQQGSYPRTTSSIG
ncbi:hypothetical protein GC175_24460 [bacterium]|nr:hypothetical protein [bacterium]